MKRNAPRQKPTKWRNRIERGVRRGLTPSQAAGKPKVGEAYASGRPRPVSDAKLETALKQLRRTGGSITQVAKEAHVDRSRLSRYIKAVAGAQRKGRRWEFNDTRIRRFKIVEAGVDQPPRLRAVGFDPAHLAGLYAFEAGEMLDDPDALLAGFQKRWAGQGVTDVHGRWHPFSTDPNQIARAILNQDYDFEKFYLIEQQEG